MDGFREEEKYPPDMHGEIEGCKGLFLPRPLKKTGSVMACQSIQSKTHCACVIVDMKIEYRDRAMAFLQQRIGTSLTQL